jgi:hypothetical protein
MKLNFHVRKERLLDGVDDFNDFGAILANEDYYSVDLGAVESHEHVIDQVVSTELDQCTRGIELVCFM